MYNVIVQHTCHDILPSTLRSIQRLIVCFMCTNYICLVYMCSYTWSTYFIDINAALWPSLRFVYVPQCGPHIYGTLIHQWSVHRLDQCPRFSHTYYIYIHIYIYKYILSNSEIVVNWDNSIPDKVDASAINPGKIRWKCIEHTQGAHQSDALCGDNQVLDAVSFVNFMHNKTDLSHIYFCPF